jgi:hypothetical protein
MKVYKDNLERDIAESRLQEYMDAGWKQTATVQVEERIVLKPPAKVKAAVTAEDNTIETQGE